MDEESVECPSNVRLSLDHSNLLQKWSAIASGYETTTEMLREVLSNYVSNLAEFNAMAAEIKYFISEGLDDDNKSILYTTSRMLRGDMLGRSPADKELMKARTTILKKVCNLFYRLRNECYPQLKSRFKPPQRAGDPTTEEIPASRRSRSRRPAAAVDIIPDPSSSIEDDGENLEDSRVQDEEEEEAEEEEGDAEEEEEEEEEEEDIMLQELGDLRRDLGEFGEIDNCQHIISIVSTVLKGKRLGVAGMFSQDECFMHSNHSMMHVRSTSISFPPEITDVFDYIVSIPRPDFQLGLLTYAIDHDVPFVLFLPLNILDIYTICNPEKHRLNIHIIGSSAWFVGNFSPKKITGKGGKFTISPPK